MKRTALFVMLCLTLLLFSACQQEPEQPVFSQPPDMAVTVTEGSVTQPWSKGNWNYTDTHGTPANMNMGGILAYKWWEQEPNLTTEDSVAQFTFALPPDEVAVSRYSVTDGSETVCELTENGSLTLTDGRWTYVFMVRWNDEGRDHHGWARYSVCVEKR